MTSWYELDEIKAENERLKSERDGAVAALAGVKLSLEAMTANRDAAVALAEQGAEIGKLLEHKATVMENTARRLIDVVAAVSETHWKNKGMHGQKLDMQVRADLTAALGDPGAVVTPRKPDPPASNIIQLPGQG